MENIILGTILGSISTVSGVFVTAFFQNKREKAKLIHNEKLFEKKNAFEIEKEYLNRKVNEIKDAHILLSWFENEYTTTASVIDYNSGISVIEYHKKYREDLTKLALLKYYMDLYYPELHERIEYLDGYLNQYWDYNQTLLEDRKLNDNTSFETLVVKISEIEALILGQIKTIKMALINKNAIKQ
jgi:hypothetical protein